MCSCVCQHVDDTVFSTCSFFSSFVTCMRCGLGVCPLIGATATFTNEALFCNIRDCHPKTSGTQTKRPIFDHRLCFFMWSRLKSCDPISLKLHFGAPHQNPEWALGGLNFETRVPRNGPFFRVWAPFLGSKKHEMLKTQTSDKTDQHVIWELCFGEVQQRASSIVCVFFFF